MQTASHILMIEPTAFRFNEVAAESNSFQNQPNGEISVQENALREFQGAVEQLREAGVTVSVFKDENTDTPDSIFPNNWISTHSSGEMILYPMAVSNRRAERSEKIISHFQNLYDYQIIDLSHFENEQPPAYLEGTGSLIFDHQSKIVYAATSPRTNSNLVEKVAEILGYKSICFKAYGKSGELIYHTNVMMCIEDSFVVIGEDTIDDNDRERVMNQLSKSGKEIVKITNNQVYNHFAGNMLQISNSKAERILVMSETALNSLNSEQLKTLETLNNKIIAFHIPTIEHVGGGSARCMLAEIYPKVSLQSK